MRRWKIGGIEITEEDVKSLTRFFLAVALILWAYNLGYHDAIRTVEYVNKVCGPGSARLNGLTAEIYITPEGYRIDPNTVGIPQPYYPIDINEIEANNTDGMVGRPYQSGR
jgi:hypothetical protein